MAAATAPAAASAAARRAAGGSRGAAGAGGGEDRELDCGFFAGALGAGDFLLLVDDDFLELHLAIVANVFIDGHDLFDSFTPIIARTTISTHGLIVNSKPCKIALSSMLTAKNKNSPTATIGDRMPLKPRMKVKPTRNPTMRSFNPPPKESAHIEAAIDVDGLAECGPMTPPYWAATADRLMMRPQRAARIPGRTRGVTRKTEVRFTRRNSFQISR